VSALHATVQLMGPLGILSWITSRVLDRTAELPHALSFFVVVAAWVIIVSLVASSITTPIQRAVWGCEYRLGDRVRAKYRRFGGSGAHFDLEPLVTAAVRRVLILERVVEVLAFFGGMSLYWVARLRIRQMIRPGALAAAGALAIWSWPNGSRWTPGDLLSDWATLIPAWNDVRLALPVAVIIVAIVVVSPRVPLLDRIRARDEAAKDANRLLARWAFAAGELSSSGHERGLEVFVHSGNLASERVSELSAHLYFSLAQLCDARDEAHWGDRFVPRVTDEYRVDALQTDLTRLEECNRAIREAGLRFVATALVPRTATLVELAGVSWHFQEGSLRSSLFLKQSRVREIMEGRVTRWDIDKYERERERGRSESRDALEELEDEVIGLETVLRGAAVTTMFRAECLRQAHNQISRRLLGSTLTRVLGAAKS
jgi:hypothetical protein